MKFAKIVFFTAGIWGITVVTPLFCSSPSDRTRRGSGC